MLIEFVYIAIQKFKSAMKTEPKMYNLYINKNLFYIFFFVFYRKHIFILDVKRVFSLFPFEVELFLRDRFHI